MDISQNLAAHNTGKKRKITILITATLLLGLTVIWGVSIQNKTQLYKGTAGGQLPEEEGNGVPSIDQLAERQRITYDKVASDMQGPCAQVGGQVLRDENENSRPRCVVEGLGTFYDALSILPAQNAKDHCGSGRGVEDGVWNEQARDCITPRNPQVAVAPQVAVEEPQPAQREGGPNLLQLAEELCVTQAGGNPDPNNSGRCIINGESMDLSTVRAYLACNAAENKRWEAGACIELPANDNNQPDNQPAVIPVDPNAQAVADQLAAAQREVEAIRNQQIAESRESAQQRQRLEEEIATLNEALANPPSVAPVVNAGSNAASVETPTAQTAPSIVSVATPDEAKQVKKSKKTASKSDSKSSARSTQNAGKKRANSNTAANVQAAAGNLRGSAQQMYGAAIQGQTGPAVLLYPLAIIGANGLYYLARHRMKK